jgi:UDP-N-acetylglucosamine--dolichyl-phosphate N-acetylglucosaminephosphotransferase
MFEMDALTFDVPVVVAVIFLLSSACVYWLMKRNLRENIVGNDINKLTKPLVAESCGAALIVPFWILIIFTSYFYGINWKVFVVGGAVTIYTIIGFMDDSKHKFLSKAIGWKVRAIPIAIISLILAYVFFEPKTILEYGGLLLLAGFFGGVASFSNTFEGLNGWTVGSSFIITLFIAFIAYRLDTGLVFLFIGLASMILGLLLFNKYPAKAFPGDSGTLLIGSSIAGFSLFSENIYFFLLVVAFFIPHMIDFFILKMMTNSDDPSQQKFRPYKLLENGRLTIPDYPDNKIRYDFAKLVMRIFGPLKEPHIVAIIWFFVATNCLFWTILFSYLNLI